MKTDTHPAATRQFRFGLYGKLALTFLLVLTLLATAYGYLTALLANRYFEATYQRLNRDVAGHIVKFMEPFGGQGVNRKGADAIFFNAMITNPSAEVYLLDSTGRIELYHAADGEIKRKRVALEPVRRYIQTQGTLFIKGDNPKNEREQSIFSAANVIRNGRMQGYVYVILTSAEYGSIMAVLQQNYVLQWGIGTMLITLLAALAIGLLAVYRLTKNLSYVIERVGQFRAGNLTARLVVKPSSELAPLADTFNDMAETLTRNIGDLQNAERLRRNLVATVSHDLRTPIAAIHGYAETLVLNNALPDARKAEYAGIILQSTDKLMKLVNELFELSKLEARQTQPYREPVVLGELVTEVFTKFRLLAEQKGLAYTCADCEDPTVCLADVGMMERVLQNLIENAIRYTPDGGFVRVNMGSMAGMLTVSVENAVGELPEPVRGYLQTGTPDGLTAGRPSGAGLGLVIVRKMLDLHNTHLNAVILPGASVRFSFSLPVYQPPTPPNQ